MPKSNHYTDEEILEDLRRTDREVESSLKTRDYSKLGNYSPATVRDRFGSWDEAKKEAGIETTAVTKQKLLNDIQRVENETDGIVGVKDYREKGKYGHTHVTRKLGSWNKAKKEAGLNTNKIGQPRQHPVDEDFFKTWNPESAYVFGLFLADGNWTEKGFSIHGQEQHLKKVSEAIGSDVEPYKNGQSYSLVIYSQEMSQDLKQFEGVNKVKSGTITLPDIPEHLEHHLLRGYFDGDGSVFMTNRGYLKTGFASVSQKLIEDVQDLLSEIMDGGSFVESQADNSYGSKIIYRLNFSVNDSIKLYEFMYQNAELYLESKRNQFEKSISATKGKK